MQSQHHAHLNYETLGRGNGKIQSVSVDAFPLGPARDQRMITLQI
jgi:hypothetical protein